MVVGTTFHCGALSNLNPNLPFVYPVAVLPSCNHLLNLLTEFVVVSLSASPITPSNVMSNPSMPISCNSLLSVATASFSGTDLLNSKTMSEIKGPSDGIFVVELKSIV